MKILLEEVPPNESYAALQPGEIKPQSLHLKDSNVSVVIDITKTSSGYRVGL